MLKVDVSTSSTRIQDLSVIDLNYADKANLHILTATKSNELAVTPFIDIKALSTNHVNNLTDVLQPQTLVGSYNTDNYTPIYLDNGFEINGDGVLNFTIAYNTDLSGDIYGTLMSPIIDYSIITYNKFTGFLQNTLTGRYSGISGHMETILLGECFFIDKTDNTLKVREQSSMCSNEMIYETKDDNFIAQPAHEYTVDAPFSISITLHNSFKNGDVFFIILKSPYSVILKTSQDNIVLERRSKRIYKFLYYNSALIDLLT